MNAQCPELKKVRAIDVRPYYWGQWCSVGDDPHEFCNDIEARKWSDDGEYIWFMLGTHNFFKAKPDDELELIPLTRSPQLSADYLKQREEEEAKFEARRPPRRTRCAHCGSVLTSTDGSRT